MGLSGLGALSLIHAHWHRSRLRQQCGRAISCWTAYQYIQPQWVDLSLPVIPLTSSFRPVTSWMSVATFHTRHKVRQWRTLCRVWKVATAARPYGLCIQLVV